MELRASWWSTAIKIESGRSTLLSSCPQATVDRAAKRNTHNLARDIRRQPLLHVACKAIYCPQLRRVFDDINILLPILNPASNYGAVPFHVCAALDNRQSVGSARVGIVNLDMFKVAALFTEQYRCTNTIAREVFGDFPRVRSQLLTGERAIPTQHGFAKVLRSSVITGVVNTNYIYSCLSAAIHRP